MKLRKILIFPGLKQLQLYFVGYTRHLLNTSYTPTERTIIVYADENGKEPVTDWLASSMDRKIRTRILRRINRIEQGNFGDHRHIVGGEGVWELRLDFGPGYRVYYAEDGATVVLLHCAGEKKSQNRDIKNRKAMSKSYRKWDEVPKEFLSDPEEARVFLIDALDTYQEDGDQTAFLQCLRQVVEAQMGFTELSRRTGKSRQHLYEALSANGNPRLDTMLAILSAVGVLQKEAA